MIMPQTDLNINPTDSVKPAENNDTVDNLLTQPSDIPVYDVLAKKQFASPEKIELIKESFILTPLKTVNKRASFKEYDPITNKIVVSGSKQIEDIKSPKITPREKITTPTETISDIEKTDTVKLTEKLSLLLIYFQTKLSKKATHRNILFSLL